MLHSELDSFILKSKSLWYSGIDAHLDVDSHAGQAWVGLRVGLGHGHPPAVQPHVQRKKESPSRQLRRARRAEARLLAAAVSTTEKVTVRTIVDSDTEKVTSRDDKSEDSTEVTTGREDPSEIDVVEEIAANFSDLNGEVRDEFCTNEEYAEKSLGGTPSTTFRFIIKDSSLCKSQEAFENKLKHEFKKAKIDKSTHNFLISRYEQFENESKF